MPKVEFETKEEITRRIGEHEVFLSFNADNQAYAFHDWITHEGKGLFEKWF